VFDSSEGGDSFSATFGKLDATVATEDVVDSAPVRSASAAEAFNGDGVESRLAKGEDLAAEPTLAFLAMTAVCLRCSVVLCLTGDRRLSGIEEAREVVVVLGRDVPDDLIVSDSREEIAA